MLNRRILRIKAFKELFAIEMSKDKSLAIAQKELDAALESTRDLYLFMLASIVPLTNVAKDRIAQTSRKINKTEQEKNPNFKFAENALAVLFDQDPDFNKIVKKRGLDNWGAYDLILRKIYASIQTKEYFLNYMASAERSLKEDCRLFIRIFEEEFVDREDFDVALEDMNLYWNDDLAYSLTCCCKTLESIAKGAQWSLPDLYLSDASKAMDDDNAFVHKLLQEAYLNYDKYFEAITSAVPNWDSDRLVGTDIAIIVTALAEIVYFPNIPLKVSINEYVEISKYYSTINSKVFVNGLLNKIIKNMLSTGEIVKSGRGLVEN